MSIFTPTNQIRFTNVAFVKVKKQGVRFEVACYRNKVKAYRAGQEKDLEEVLQSEEVFTNASKGEIASKQQLVKCFGTDDKRKIIETIVSQGEYKMSDKERETSLSDMTKDLCILIARSTINPESNKPYPASMIEKALKQLGVSVDPSRNIKKQANEAVKLLKTIIPILRTRIEIKLIVSEELRELVTEQVGAAIEGAVFKVEKGEEAGTEEVGMVLEPENLKTLKEVLGDFPDVCMQIVSLNE